MLESIRSHRRWLMFFLLALVFPSFVVTGIYSYSRMAEGDNAVARVDGEPITPQELDAAQRQRLDQMRQMMGANFDPKLLENDAVRAATLDSLIAERALMREAARDHMALGPQRLQEVIASIPAFQQDGKFNYEQYKTILNARGYTEQRFEREVHDELLREQLLRAVSASAVAPKTVQERLQRIIGEKRELRELRFTAAEFAAKVNPTDEALQAYYETHRSAFEMPERMKVEYVVLNLDDVAAQIAVPEAEARAYYEQNQARYGDPERRRASHILLTAGDGGTAKDKDGARKKAEELLVQLRKNPNDFDRLAREQSKDPGSASKGGDLGFFDRNMMVKPFSDAAFAQKPGEIGGVVESDFGFHIIRVTEVKPAQAKPFEQVRAEIEREYRRQQAQKKYAEAAEQFTNLVYEQADSLQAVAEKLKLKVQTVDNLTRAGLPASQGAPQIFGPKLTQALFAEESLKNKRNTEAVEVAPNLLAAARVLDYQPAAVRPLDEVRAAVRARVIEEEAAKLARAAGAEKLVALQKAPSDTGFSAPRSVTRTQAEGLSPAALKAIMAVPSDKLPAFVGAELAGGGYGVFHVLSAQVSEQTDAQQRESLAQALTQQLGSADDSAYLAALKAKYQAEVLKPELRVPADTAKK
jgi:peptidyl-prolyl cis-trans isomerase D